MSTRFLPWAIVAALLQSGCVTYTQSQPKVEGHLIDSQGKAIAGADITLSSNSPDASTVTDSNGFFSFPGAHQWSLFLPLGPIDKINRSALIIRARDRQYAVPLDYGIGGPYASGLSEAGLLCILPGPQPISKEERDDADICRRMPLTQVKEPRTAG